MSTIITKMDSYFLRVLGIPMVSFLPLNPSRSVPLQKIITNNYCLVPSLFPYQSEGEREFGYFLVLYFLGHVITPEIINNDQSHLICTADEILEYNHKKTKHKNFIP